MAWQVLVCLFSLGATIIGATLSPQWNHVIYINPSSGSNTSDCGTVAKPCRNLTYALQFRKNSTVYRLSPGVHYLDNTTYLNPLSLSGVGMTGTPTSTEVQCVGDNAGLSFIGGRNISLEDIAFSHCAAYQNSTSQVSNHTKNGTLRMYAGLYFYNCVNVQMTQITVKDSRNATGVVMFDVTGHITVVQSSFIGNKAPLNVPGGGGFYVEFTFCKPGDAHCRNSHGPYTLNNTGSLYKFTHCNFSDNTNNSTLGPSDSWYVLPRGKIHSFFGRGAGLSLYMKGSATDNQFEITNCTFERNTAIWGGGVAIHILDKTSNASITVNNCTFSDNWMQFTSGSSGGAVDILYYVYGRHGFNKVTFDGTTFSNNSASMGGALCIFAASQSTSNRQSPTVSISNSHFENNKAGSGAAAFLSRYMVVLEGEVLKVIVTGSHFINNSLNSVFDATYLEGVGTVYIDNLPVQFRKSIGFKGNNGTALGVSETYVDFSGCHASFINNVGYEGGAIALLSSAWVNIDNTTSMSFIHNTAYTKGGAIYKKYSQKGDISVFPNCFLKYKPSILLPVQWNSSFYFEDNSAGLHGNSIYCTSLWPCADSGNLSTLFFWRGWTYRRNNETMHNSTEEIGSDVGKITFETEQPVKTFPGKYFSLPLRLLDDLGNDITHNAVFVATTWSRNVGVPDLAYITKDFAKLYGQPCNSPVNLVVDTVSERVWHITIKVIMKPCPPGFTLSSADSKAYCKCTRTYGNQLRCDDKNYEATLMKDYWMGPSPYNNETLVVGLCPNRVCFSNKGDKAVPLTNETDKLDSQVCGSAMRTGVLCGQCIHGYAPSINSQNFQCVPCNNTSIATNIVYYFISVYVPLFVLFTVIIIVNIRLTSGPAVAFILYSQVISSTFLPDEIRNIPSSSGVGQEVIVLSKLYVWTYGIFNLEFIENIIRPLCLGKDMNNLDVLQVDYLVALFPLLMILFVIACIKLNTMVSALCGRHERLTHFLYKLKPRTSLLHAFAAFVLLSYTKFSLTSSYIINNRALIDENNTEISGPKRVYFAGQYANNDSYYWYRYLVPAIIVFATFVAIPPLLLLQYPVKLLEICINRFHFLQRLYPADKVHILEDTFQGCYRNNTRFFAGLYFIFRLIMHLSSNLVLTINQFVLQQIACIAFAVLVALCRPYTRTFLNYIDILMFAHLTVINTFSMFMWMLSDQLPDYNLLYLYGIQYLLIMLPWLCMILYIIWYCLGPKNRARMKRWLNLCPCNATGGPGQSSTQSNRTIRNLRGVAAVSDRDSGETVDDMEALLTQAEQRNAYRPPVRNATEETRPRLLTNKPKHYGSI